MLLTDKAASSVWTVRIGTTFSLTNANNEKCLSPNANYIFGKGFDNENNNLCIEYCDKQ